MGVKRGTKLRRWSTEEEALLKERYPLGGPRPLVSVLGRSRGAIQAAALRLHIKTLCRKGERAYNFVGYKDVPGDYVHSVGFRARRKGLVFTLTPRFVYDMWVRQKGVCYYSGYAITFIDRTASIDRKDSTRGYTEDSVVLVHKNVNSMKMRRTESEFLDLVHQIKVHLDD